MRSAKEKINQPKQARSRETMQKLLDTAQQMLLDQTFDQANIHEIIKRAGSSVGSFYSLFKSKENLLDQLLENYNDRINDFAIRFNHEAGFQVSGITARAKLFIDEYIKACFLERGILRARHINRVSKKETFLPESLSKIENYFREIKKYFHPCMLEITHPDPEQALLFALEVIDVYVNEKIVLREPPKDDNDYSKLKTECLRLFLSYLGI